MSETLREQVAGIVKEIIHEEPDHTNAVYYSYAERILALMEQDRTALVEALDALEAERDRLCEELNDYKLGYEICTPVFGMPNEVTKAIERIEVRRKP